jgi:hypothetical protein
MWIDAQVLWRTGLSSLKANSCSGSLDGASSPHTVPELPILLQAGSLEVAHGLTGWHKDALIVSVALEGSESGGAVKEDPAPIGECTMLEVAGELALVLREVVTAGTVHDAVTEPAGVDVACR